MPKWLARQYFGSPAHLCVSFNCHFHLATLIGDKLVSTVGEYIQSSAPDRAFTAVGSGLKDFYETMVFTAHGSCDCGCGLPNRGGSELLTRRYATPQAANEGHELICQRVERGDPLA
jgi:hypothetical protein